MMKDDESGLPKEVAEELDEALLSLAGKSREMIVMRFFEGAGYGKVAGQFGLTEEAARKRDDSGFGQVAGCSFESRVHTGGDVVARPHSRDSED